MVGIDSGMVPTSPSYLLKSLRVAQTPKCHSFVKTFVRRTLAPGAHLFGRGLDHLPSPGERSNAYRARFARARRSASQEPPSTHQRRRKRRGLFQPRWEAPDFPEYPRWPNLRPAVRDERRWIARPPRVERAREDDVRLLHERRPPHLLRLEPGAREGLSAAPRPLEGICLAARSVRHLHGAARRLQPPSPNAVRGLYSRGCAVARRTEDRLHVP